MEETKDIKTVKTNVIKEDETKVIQTEESKDFNTETLMRLDLLNRQMADLLQMQRKMALGCEYITARELAELLGEKLSTIYARVHSRKIPFYKPGGKVLLFKLDEIQEWIQSGRRSTIDELRERI